MNTHRRMTRIGMSPPAVRGKHAKGASRTDSPRDAAHRIVLTALLLGSLAASSAALSAHVGGAAVARDLAGAEHILNTPWMY